MEVTRRNLIQILGAAAPAAAAAQEHQHAAAPVRETKSATYTRKVFDDHQWRTVRVLCDLIIPADESSPNASGAGVPEFMDDWLDFRRREDGNDHLAALIQGGLSWLDAESRRLFQKDFALAAEQQQTQIVDRIAWPAKATAEDRRWVAFFNRFRDLTVSGYFSSKAGVADLPYLGNKAVAEWKGCDEKTWGIIEDRVKKGYKGVGGESGPLAL